MVPSKRWCNDIAGPKPTLSAKQFRKKISEMKCGSTLVILRERKLSAVVWSAFSFVSSRISTRGVVRPIGIVLK